LPLFSVVIPALDEPYLPTLIHRIKGVAGLPKPEIIIRSDPGCGNAILRGIHAAKNDLIVVMDGDGSHDPAHIPSLLEALGEADIAYGYKARSHDTRLRRLISKLMSLAVKILIMRDLPDLMSGYFAIDRGAIPHLPRSLDHPKVLAHIILHNPQLRVKPVPITFHRRKAGKSKPGHPITALRIIRGLLRIQNLRWRIAQMGERLWRIKQTVKHSPKGYKRLLRLHNQIMLTRFFGLDPQGFGGLTAVEFGGGLHGILPLINARRRINVDPLVEPGVRHGVLNIRAKGEECPLSTDLADVVFCRNVLNHVEDPNRFLRQIARVLKPTGRLYLSLHLEPRGLLHPHAFTPEGVREAVSAHFVVEKTLQSTTRKLFGGDYEDKAVWGCVARLREMTG